MLSPLSHRYVPVYFFWTGLEKPAFMINSATVFCNTCWYTKCLLPKIPTIIIRYRKNRAGFRECAPFFPPYLACSDVTLCSFTLCSLLEKHTVRTAVFCLLGKRSIRSRRSFFLSEKSVHEAMPWLDCLSLSRQPQIDSDDSQCGPDLIAISASTAETVAESVCPVWWK